MSETMPSNAVPRRVLLVDDHAETAELLELLLARRGFAVTVAGSMSAALAAAERGFDVLVSDIELPDGNGCDLLALLRATRPLPAIAMSGLDRDADVQRTRAAGFAEHLTKPVRIEQLVDALGRVGGG